jgi:hypothetical protein
VQIQLSEGLAKTLFRVARRNKFLLMLQQRALPIGLGRHGRITEAVYSRKSSVLCIGSGR